MARLPRPPAFTTRATRSSPPTARFSDNGIWSSPSARRIAGSVVCPRSFRSFGKNGGSILVWPPPTRQRTDSNDVYRHLYRATKGLLPRDEPRRKVDAPHRLDAKEAEG